jgi:N,N-dimethylformamidase beta subunit-like, C-terminal/Domain of unknown function (DUF4082)/Bacterial Ig-like domain/Bacterial Ig domain
MRASLVAALAIAGLLGPLAHGARAACPAPPGANAIVVENCQPGSPPSEWDVSGAGSDLIQGFATNISVNKGTTVSFKIDTPATAYRLDIYRMGYYGGDGARKVATVNPSASLPQNQPNCLFDAGTGLVDCGNWAVSASWAVPATAVSGVYFAKAVRTDGTAGSSHIFFVVRDDGSHSPVYYQTSDTTWQAYNTYGGESLYAGGPLAGGNTARAAKVSYNRPFITRGVDGGQDWVFNAEYPMIRWLERNGYDVSYETGVDSDRFGSLIRNHRVFMSTGHDEYWSGPQRANVEAARDAGVNLAFFSGNEVFWKTRWENSIDGSGTSYRTLVSYKETHENAHVDPSGQWTGTWRDARSFNPQGPQPENALTGTLFTVNIGTTSIQVPADDGNLRLWRGTDVAGQASGSIATLTDGTLGYEWDEDPDNGARPAGLVRMSSTTADGVDKLQDNGSTYASGTATHHLTLYRDTNGAGPDALVFGAGTVQWSWGLDANHERGNAPASRAMQQATVNLFADMGVQPGSLQSDLGAAAASTDTAPPSATIVSPATGTSIAPGTSVIIQGTASDAGGGRVGAVEVSLDGGSTWHPATGRESWRYTWTPSSTGQVTIEARASDDSANVGSETSTTVAVGGTRGCPCSLFGDATPSGSGNDGQPIEVGVRFSADDDGFITGLRYYRGAGWSGTRTGHLWTATGTLLSTATFIGDSLPGWHEVSLPSPVHVTAGTTYVASYLSSDGSYSADPGFFTTDFNAAPLHAPASTATSPNGAYVYGGGFPTTGFGAANYGADVVFTHTDQTPPIVTAVAPADGAVTFDPGTRIAAAFDEPLDPATVGGATVQLRNAAGALVPADVSYAAASRTITLTPRAALAVPAAYTATVKGGAAGVRDAAGNPLAHDRTWSFTTAPASTGPSGEGGPATTSQGSSKAGKQGAGAGPRVKLSPRTLRVSKAGTVKVKLACPASAGSCRVQLSLQVGKRTVARKTLTVAGGKSKTVTLRLSRSARRDLQRKHSLKATAVSTVRDRAGRRATTRTPTVLLAPRRR